ncbi:MAG: PhoH family protein [Actinomycetales bacterium]|nr:PhoH family protein [Actinomycetales bacterium]
MSSGVGSCNGHPGEPVTGSDPAAAADPSADEDRRCITVPPSLQMVALLGAADELIRVVEAAFPAVDVHVRGNVVTLTGRADEVALLQQAIEELLAVLRTGQSLSPETVARAIEILRSDSPQPRPSELLTASILTSRGRSIRPKTLNQKRYVDAIDAHTIVFGIGPAGTGKTYLAVAKAVDALLAKRTARIVLTRPAVEAGERLGFLPGTLSEKIDPYLRPLYDALQDMIDPERIGRLMTNGTIEVAPLAYMRGRTLNDAFIILDEAQNTTPEQMKMFLTRLGFGSSMVITGDVTQVDLPSGARSGLRVVESILQGIPDVAFIRLGSRDVVRNPLVSRIVDAYEHHDAGEEGTREPVRSGRHAR